MRANGTEKAAQRCFCAWCLLFPIPLSKQKGGNNLTHTSIQFLPQVLFIPKPQPDTLESSPRLLPRSLRPIGWAGK